MKEKESPNAKAVARDAISMVSKGQKVNFQEIQKRHGYSHKSARSMKAIRTKTYQREIKPLLERLEEARNDALNRLPKKIGSARYRDLMDGVDKLTKNIQLLSGKPTENIHNDLTDLSDDELIKLARGKSESSKVGVSKKRTGA